jgi:hypothetical protein
MSFDVTATMRAVETHLKDAENADGNALFKGVSIRRTRSALPTGPSAAISVESARVVETTLTNAIELHQLRVRLFRASNIRSEETTVTQSADLVSQVFDLFYGDITLGGRVRNIDVGGQYSSGLEVRWDEEMVAETDYYVADISLPLIVDSETEMTQ